MRNFPMARIFEMGWEALNGHGGCDSILHACDMGEKLRGRSPLVVEGGKEARRARVLAHGSDVNICLARRGQGDVGVAGFSGRAAHQCFVNSASMMISTSSATIER